MDALPLSVLYADTSAIVRAYFPDEPEHDALRGTLLGSGAAVITSEVARLEFASAVHSAVRAGRLDELGVFVDRFDVDTGPAGAIALVALERDSVFPAARRLLLDHALRALDAVHLATALAEAAHALPGSEIVFVTRDEAQAEAARTLGLEVR